MNKFLVTLINGFPSQWIIVLMVATSVGFSCGPMAAFWTVALYAICSFIYIVSRQIYWRITKTGDYAYMQKSSKAIPADTEADSN
jgi:hypothetical protein